MYNARSSVLKLSAFDLTTHWEPSVLKLSVFDLTTHWELRVSCFGANKYVYYFYCEHKVYHTIKCMIRGNEYVTVCVAC